MRELLSRMPFLSAAIRLFRRKSTVSFASANYWENRYRRGGNSGAGSLGRLAEFKAEVLNDFITQHEIASVIEFGSGDGNQLMLASYPSYIGVDVSETAIQSCRVLFAEDNTKIFLTLSDYDGQRADLSLSLDVIFHLVEDLVFEGYMQTLFDSADRFVIVYASNRDEEHHAAHVRHRKFTDWVEANRPDFCLIHCIPNRFPFDTNDKDNTSFADFFVFEKNRGQSS